MKIRILVLVLLATSCVARKSRALPEWLLNPESPQVRMYGFGVSLPTADTAEATRQAQTMAAAMLAFSREVRISSFQSIAEDSAGSGQSETTARFLSSISDDLPAITRLERLAGNITVVEVSGEADSATPTSALEASWYEHTAGDLSEVSLTLVAGDRRLEWARQGDSLQFLPESPESSRSKFDATDWVEQPSRYEGFQSASASAEFSNAPGSFQLAFFSAYVHALSHLSHSIQSEMAGSAQMFSKKRSGAAMKTSSNTILPGARVLHMAILANAAGGLTLEVTVGTPKDALQAGS